MNKFVPLLMLFLGVAAGVGAGVFLRPDKVPGQPSESVERDQNDMPEARTEQAADVAIDSLQYIKLSNQFVIPIVQDEKIASMVVMTLSVEVPDGRGQLVYDMEPKIRDTFLRVLFDYATIGLFDGAFLNNQNLDTIRSGLREAAHRVFGQDLINDVLIFEIARQDY